MGSTNVSPRFRAVFAAAVCFGSIALLVGCTGYSLPATEIGPTSATMNAAGSCKANCSVRFKYREVSPNLGSWTYTETFSAGGTNGKEIPFADYAKNLAQGATYQYQVCGKEASDQKEACVGPDRRTDSYSTFKTRVRLMTYNVEYFKELDNDGVDDNPTNGAAIQAIASDIAASKASIVALEEVRRFNGFDEAQKVADALGWTGPTHVTYAGWIHDPNGCQQGSTCIDKGVAIISRFPLSHPPSHKVDPQYANTLERKLLWTDVDLGGGQSLRVYATHLATGDSPYGDAYPRAQLYDTFDFLRGQNNTDHISRAVFMGDLNLSRATMDIVDKPRTSSPYDHIKGVGYADWKDSRVAPGDPACGKVSVYACTFSNFSKGTHAVTTPSQKFDWIWVKGAFETAGAVINNCVSGCHSDHRPYWTDLAF